MLEADASRLKRIARWDLGIRMYLSNAVFHYLPSILISRSEIPTNLADVAASM